MSGATYSVKFTLGGHDHGWGRDAVGRVFRSVIEPISGKRFASRWQPDTTYNPLPHEHLRCISPSLLNNLLTNDAATAVILGLVYPPQRFGNTLLHATGEPRVANGTNSRQRCSNLHTRIPVPVMGNTRRCGHGNSIDKLTYAARPSAHSQGARAPAPDLRSAAHAASDPKSHHHDARMARPPITNHAHVPVVARMRHSRTQSSCWRCRLAQPVVTRGRHALRDTGFAEICGARGGLSDAHLKDVYAEEQHERGSTTCLTIFLGGKRRKGHVE
ncbi:hypothetical protein B0H11DRAFT_1899533 [Mycena galericulata]|nr:hypothetical protein B0H11DRAFT_1899533 [Mycena galericulata]